MANTKITSRVIADDAVLTANIADDAVTSAKLDTNIAIAGTLDVTGAVTADAGVSIDNITIDGTQIDLSSGDLDIDVAGNIRLDADDSGEVRFQDGGTTYATIKKDGNDALIQSIVADGDLKFQGIDGSSFITPLSFDMSEGGNATFSGGQSQTITFFTDSGSSQGDTGLIFKTDGSSENQRIATIFAQQGSGDGASQKGEIVFQVADNGNPATAITISNNKRVIAHSSLLVGQTSDNGMSGNGIESAGSIRANNFILSTDLAGSGFRNLNSSSNGTITNSTSLRELKENIVDMSLGLSDVMKLKPREFDWKDAVEHGTEDIGFIADEVFDVSPKLATYKVGDKIKDNLQGVKYDTMTSLLVKAIQELSDKNDALEARIKTLEEA